MWYPEPSPGAGCFSLDPDLSSYLHTFLTVASNESIFWSRCKILGYASILIENEVTRKLDKALDIGFNYYLIRITRK